MGTKICKTNTQALERKGQVQIAMYLLSGTLALVDVYTYIDFYLILVSWLLNCISHKERVFSQLLYHSP